MKNYTNISKFFLLIIFPLLFVACDDDEDDVVNEVVAPATYEFTRDGVSTVSFSGQTTRLNQVDAIYNYLNFKAEDGSKPVFKTEAQLKEMFADGAGFMTASLNGTGKKVRSKTGSGCNTTTGASVQVFMDNLLKEFATQLGTQAAYDTDAANGSAGRVAYTSDPSKVIHVNSKGQELDQLFVKGLIGGMALDQIVNNYILPCKLDAPGYRDENDAGTTASGKNYTNMEHKWDEGFGYLYGQEPDVTRADLGTAPGGEGTLLMKYFKKINADQVAGSKSGEPMGPIVFDAFKLGRAAIVAGNYDVRDAQANIIKIQLSKVIAFKAIDYLQSYMDKMAAGDRGYAHHALSEGYGFIQSLQFTNDGTDKPYFSGSEVDAMLANLGDFWNIDNSKLTSMISTIKSKFNI